jgi:hypothetical protein
MCPLEQMRLFYASRSMRLCPTSHGANHTTPHGRNGRCGSSTLHSSTHAYSVPYTHRYRGAVLRACSLPVSQQLAHHYEDRERRFLVQPHRDVIVCAGRAGPDGIGLKHRAHAQNEPHVRDTIVARELVRQDVAPVNNPEAEYRPHRTRECGTSSLAKGVT